MKTTVRAILWVGIMVAQFVALSALCGFSQVSATSTVDGSVASDHDMIISGLSITNNNLDYVQIFNGDNKPYKLSGWRLVVLTSEGERYFNIVPGTKDGWIEPNSHIVASSSGRVENASADFAEPVINLAKDLAGKYQLGLVSPVEMNLRAEMEFIKPGSTLRENLPWTRTLTSTGYGEAYIDSQEYERLYKINMSQRYLLFDNGLYVAPDNFSGEIKEIYSYASGCNPFDKSVTCGDYVKFSYTGNPDDLDMYVLRTDSNSSSRTTSNTFSLSGAVTHDSYHYLVYLDDAQKRIALNNSSGNIWFEDKYGINVFEKSLRIYMEGNADHQGWSYIEHNNSWQWTVEPQPFRANKFSLPLAEPIAIKSCPVGQYRNPDTGRCRTLEEAINVLSTCDEGYERNPATNRCRKISTTSSVSLTPCKEGQVRNPETNRCRSIASEVADLIPCDEGLERNPATNRCRKVAGASTTVASSPSTSSPASTPLNLDPYSVAGVVAVIGLAYAGYEWRGEATSGYHRLIRRFGKK